MKSGIVALIGRPNVGKSTLINNLIGQKVAITSPKPQTTRFPIEAKYEDERGQIIFVDTPGIFLKAKDALSQKINKKTLNWFGGEIDAAIYIVDHTRKRDFEEARVLGIVRKITKPKILVINKIDVTDKTFLPQYLFLTQEFPTVIQLSARTGNHLALLLDAVFAVLPEGKNINLPENMAHPALNMDSKIFLSEIIREKIFLKTRKEVPYSTMVIIDEITDKGDITYIKARILTTKDVYKKMLIGAEGRRIKQIGMMTRKELELATGKKIYLDLKVETDKHWVQTMV